MEQRYAQGAAAALSLGMGFGLPEACDLGTPVGMGGLELARQALSWSPDDVNQVPGRDDRWLSGSRWHDDMAAPRIAH